MGTEFFNGCAMAGSLDVRFAALGLEVGATGGAKVTYSKGPMCPGEGTFAIPDVSMSRFET